MRLMTTTDTRMHETYKHDSDCGRYWWYQYRQFTQRRWWLFGIIPIWCERLDVEERPLHELIRKATSG